MLTAVMEKKNRLDSLDGTPLDGDRARSFPSKPTGDRKEGDKSRLSSSKDLILHAKEAEMQALREKLAEVATDIARISFGETPMDLRGGKFSGDSALEEGTGQTLDASTSSSISPTGAKSTRSSAKNSRSNSRNASPARPGRPQGRRSRKKNGRGHLKLSFEPQLNQQGLDATPPTARDLRKAAAATLPASAMVDAFDVDESQHNSQRSSAGHGKNYKKKKSWSEAGADTPSGMRSRLSTNEELLVEEAVKESLTEQEVQTHASEHKSHHMRSVAVSKHLVVALIRPPIPNEEPHSETFFELFYDLIVVVVFVKLSFLKYNFSACGIFVVFSLFANFWSCWSLMNTYTTMLHAEDALTRLYYVLHIFAAFLMALTVEHPSHDFFHFKAQAHYLAAASILGRVFTAGMWLRAGCFDLERTRKEDVEQGGGTNPDSLSDFTKRSGRRQVALHFTSILVAMALFAVTAVLPVDSIGPDHKDEDHSGEDLEDPWVVFPFCALWLAAVGVEQWGQSQAVVYMKLPYAVEYASARMQAWIMACFGECVIALLIEPIFFAASQVFAIVASFSMILCICTAHFDIVDADQFLWLFTIRGEKAKAWWYMNSQLVFSFAIFVSGVSLKTLMFVSATVYNLERDAQCGSHNKHLHHQHQDRSARQLGAFDSSLFITDLGLEGWGGESGTGSRSLAVHSVSWTIVDLDELMFKAFLLLCVSCSGSMLFTITIGYSIPTALPKLQLHVCRVGASLLCLATLLVPFYLGSLETDCLVGAEEAASGRVGQARERHHSNVPGWAGRGGGGGGRSRLKGLSLVQGLLCTSALILASFFTLFGSLDPNREETYAKLEEAAHLERTKAHLIHGRSVKLADLLRKSILAVNNTAAAVNGTARGAARMMSGRVRSLNLSTVKRGSSGSTLGSESLSGKSKSGRVISNPGTAATLFGSSGESENEVKSGWGDVPVAGRGLGARRTRPHLKPVPSQRSLTGEGESPGEPLGEPPTT